MSIQIAEISQRLQSALDSSYNVADMDTVLQVISTLENIQITKEQLETTRLGKYINHLRRKTANESLARRAKNLLKKWREMVLPSAGATQQQTNPNTQQNLMPTIAKDSPAALGMQYDGRSVQPPYYNQMKEPAQFHDISSTSLDNSKYPTSDSRRHGRGHDTGSNHAPVPSSIKNIEMAAEPSEDCTQRYSKFHDINKSNLSTNIGRSPASANFSGKSKETDPYRTLSVINDNSKSHISISALPKIPKIKNSAATQRLSKHTDRSHSPLVNLKESSSPKFSSIAHDDNSMHAYDMQNYKRFPPNQSSILNGRNQDYDENNSTPMDNNSNSSSINIITEMNVPNVSQPSSGIVNNEVVKKKHKKHKKDKKSKKQKQSSSPPADRIPVAGPSILELPDSLSSNSMSLFASTSDSIKDQHVLTNNNAFANSIATSLPITSINAATASTAAVAAKNALWTPTPKSNIASTDDLTFTGKFSKNDENIIINIDSSSGSNSPKFRTRSPMLIPAISRSSSPPRLNMLPIRTTDFGSRVATDEENSSNQHIPLIQQTESSRASPFGECLVQDELLANDAAKVKLAQSNAASSVMDVQQTGKKRGRKKGSKGVDSRLGSASNSSHSQQAGAPYYDSISFSSLKNKIDLIRGTTKKVKTTKELLAELQNRKAPTSGDDVSVVDAQTQPTIPYPDDDENAVTNGKHNLGSRTATPTSPVLSSVSRSERSNKKSKSAAKDGSMSDNQSLYENQVVAEITQPKSLIDQEISELIAKLPTIRKSALRAWRKSQFHDALACTCKLIESEEAQNMIDGVQSSDNFDANDNSKPKDPSLVNESVPKMLTDCNVLPQTPFDQRQQQQLGGERSAFTEPIPQSNFNSTVATSTSISIPIGNPATNERPPEPMDPPAKKPTVKSIFDLDYDDDDDDPITFKLNHNNNINLNTKVKLSSSRDSNNDISDDKSCDELFLNENIKKEDDGGNETDGVAGTVKRSVPFNDNMAATVTATTTTTTTKSNFLNMDQSGQSDDVDRKDIVVDVNAIAGDSAAKSMQDEPKALNATVDLNAMALQSRFRIEEDPDCKAKQLYITSKQSITEFHIEKLHTSYIPNINGNWDDAKNDEVSTATEATTSTTAAAAGDSQTADGCGENPSQMQCDDAEPTARSKDGMESTTTMVQQQGEEIEATEELLKDVTSEPRITEATIGLYDRVVPLCNHLNMDRLPKNLSHINLDFGPDDEIEPHIFIASIQVKKEVITPDQVSPPSNECEAAAKNIDQSNANANNEDLIADDTFATRIHQDFPIYDCDNDIDDIECGRKRSPALSFAHMHRECETMEPDFDCEPVEPLDMEVDDIVIVSDEIKSDNDLCPIANDPFVEPAEPKHFDEESDVESFASNEVVRPSPVIDDNARADTDDIEPLHQVIDLNPTQILPTTDENAMDSMDFENQLSKSYDMTMVNEQEERKTVRNRSDGSKSNEATDAELEPVGSIPTTDLSESDDEENEANDDSSLEEDLSFDNYEQEDTSNDHFITLDNFDAALVPSSSEFKQSPSNNSGSSCDEEPNKDTALEGKLFGSMVCDDDENEMSDSDDIDDDSDTINNLVVPTMFCKPVFIEGGKPSNLLNDNSDSQSAMNSDDLSEVKPLEAESSDSNLDDKLVTDQIKNPELNESTGISETQEPAVQKLTKDALETHLALSTLNESSNQQKRFRSSSSSSTSSTSSSTSSSSTLSPRSKKMKRWMRRRPCPQHYRCASTSSQSSSHSPMSALSPSSLFTNSNAIEPSDPARMDTESTAVKDFVPVPDLEEHIDSEFDNGHVQKTISEGVQEQQELSQEPLHKNQVERSDTAMETNTSLLPEFGHDELIEGNASLSETRDDDLLFQQLPLPDQLLQSDEKDGDDDSNSAVGIHRNGLIQNQDSVKPADGQELQDQKKEKCELESSLSSENNGMLPSFNSLGADNTNGVSVNGYKFKEWYEVVHVKSYNDELLTILPYVVID